MCPYGAFLHLNHIGHISNLTLLFTLLFLVLVISFYVELNLNGGEE